MTFDQHFDAGMLCQERLVILHDGHIVGPQVGFVEVEVKILTFLANKSSSDGCVELATGVFTVTRPRRRWSPRAFGGQRVRSGHSGVTEREPEAGTVPSPSIFTWEALAVLPRQCRCLSRLELRWD